MKLKVGAIYYEVEETEGLCDTDGTKLNGVIDTDKCVIGIDAGMNESKKRLELWHETVHAIDVFFAIKLTEKQVAYLAKGICMVQEDNEELSKRW